MESNSVCNHTSDWQNQTTTWRSPICLITSMITHRIGRHKVVTNYTVIIILTKFVNDIGSFLKSKHKKFQDFLSTHMMAHTVLLNCLLRLKSGQLITNQIWEFCYSMIMSNAVEIIVFLQYLSKTGRITVETIERLTVSYK